MKTKTRSSLKFSPIFCPKLGEDQKAKGHHSNLVRFFWVWDKTKGLRLPFVCSKPEVESRTQGSRPRPRTQKKSEAKAKDSLSEDGHSRGQGQEYSRPRTKDTSASAVQKKRSSQKFFRRSPKKKSSQKFFWRSPQKNVFQKIFQALHKILTIQKIVLSSSRGQANFRGLEASRPRTSKCVLEDVLEAKDVLEDSTSAQSFCPTYKGGHSAILHTKLC